MQTINRTLNHTYAINNGPAPIGKTVNIEGEWKNNLYFLEKSFNIVFTKSRDRRYF